MEDVYFDHTFSLILYPSFQQQIEIEFEHLGGVKAEDLCPRLVAQMLHLALYRFRRMRPRTLGVRIVIGPHEVVYEVPLLREFKTGAVFLKCSGAVAAEILAGEFLELRISPQMMLAVRFVHRVQRPRHPPDSALHRCELEPRES